VRDEVAFGPSFRTTVRGMGEVELWPVAES